MNLQFFPLLAYVAYMFVFMISGPFHLMRNVGIRRLWEVPDLVGRSLSIILYLIHSIPPRQ